MLVKLTSHVIGVKANWFVSIIHAAHVKATHVSFNDRFLMRDH